MRLVPQFTFERICQNPTKKNLNHIIKAHSFIIPMSIHVGDTQHFVVGEMDQFILVFLPPWFK